MTTTSARRVPAAQLVTTLAPGTCVEVGLRGKRRPEAWHGYVVAVDAFALTLWAYLHVWGSLVWACSSTHVVPWAHIAGVVVHQDREGER